MDSSAVAWQPPVVTLGNYPIEGSILFIDYLIACLHFKAINNADCFHPSLEAHELVASGFWNRMVAPTEEKAVVIPWSTTPKIRCLQEDDRILTKNLL